MWETPKGQRRTFRDQDPPRITLMREELIKRDECEISKSTPNSPTAGASRCAALEKCLSEPEFFQKKGKNRDGRDEDGDRTTKVPNGRVCGDSNKVILQIFLINDINLR